MKTLQYTTEGDKQYFIPIDWGNTSVLYRPDLVDIRGILDHPLGRALQGLSVGADGTETVPIAGSSRRQDPFNMTDEELEATKQLLIKQKPLLRFYWDSNAAVEQALASGELVASTGWNSSVVTLQGQGVPVKP